MGQKLWKALIIYALFGLFALGLLRQPVFALSIYLHGMTFVFLGMFVAGSAGEILFNKEEADILMHRPVQTRTLLWAKIRVLVEVSLWLAGAFNLAGLLAGVAAPDGGWRFPIAHAFSTVLEALFCAGCVVMIYQLCLRWFGRERLEGLMTTAQVSVSVAAVLAGQIVPRLIGQFGGRLQFKPNSWWIVLLPPAWFAGLDDGMAGRSDPMSWMLAGMGLIATIIVLWLAFGKLSHDYHIGLQTLSEVAPRSRFRRGGRSWVNVLANTPLLRWWLRDPVTRASFLLTTAYLIRDRDVKLRVYPGLAPMLVLPIIFLLPSRSAGSGGSFGIAFAGGYLGLVPLLGLNLLQHSQQWQATDVFRVAPLSGPAGLCRGARRAVLFCLTLPIFAAFGLLTWLIRGTGAQLTLLLPGIIALPAYALAACLGGKGVPLSLPVEEAKAAQRGLTMIGMMLVAMALSGLAVWSSSTGWFLWLILGETLVVACLCMAMTASLAKERWAALE